MKLDLIPKPLVIINMAWFEIKSGPDLSTKKTHTLGALADIEMMYEIENQMDEIKESTLPRRDSIFTLERKNNSKIILKKTRIEITTKYFSFPTQVKYPVSGQPCRSRIDEH